MLGSACVVTRDGAGDAQLICQTVNRFRFEFLVQAGESSPSSTPSSNTWMRLALTQSSMYLLSFTEWFTSSASRNASHLSLCLDVRACHLNPCVSPPPGGFLDTQVAVGWPTALLNVLPCFHSGEEEDRERARAVEESRREDLKEA